MKVLGIAGSPRREGNTEILLDEALRGAEEKGLETEKIVLTSFQINPCRACHSCSQRGECALKDEMQLLYPRLLAADHIILASPVFFYGVTAQAKAFIDRCQALWARKYVLKEKLRPAGGRYRGIFIGVGATKGEKLFLGPHLTVYYFFETLELEFAGELLVRGVDEKGAIKNYPAQLTRAFQLGQSLALPTL